MTDELILTASGTTMDDREYLRRVYGGACWGSTQEFVWVAPVEPTIW